MLHHLANHTAVASSDDQHVLGVGVRVQGEVSNHLLVRSLITSGQLNHAVQNQHVAERGALEHKDVLK